MAAFATRLRVFGGAGLAAVSGLTAASYADLRSLRSSVVFSHCQVPCGIFEDQARVKSMMEHAVTIRKAMVQTEALSSKVASGDAQSLNQSCRWVSTKDEHADKIISTTAEYFLAQRVVDKPAGSPEYYAYLEQLAKHHAVMKAAMKTKQTVDPAAADKLDDALHTVSHMYGGH